MLCAVVYFSALPEIAMCVVKHINVMGGNQMSKSLSWKSLKKAYWFLAGFIVLMICGMIHWMFYILSIVPLIPGFIYMRKTCRCPHCGTFEGLARLTHSKNHIYHCRNCGEIIVIDE